MSTLTTRDQRIETASKRTVKFDGREVDMKFAAELASEFEKKHFQDDAIFVKIECSVLGNAVGAEGIEGERKLSALRALLGTEYNNARITFPFTEEWVKENVIEFEELLDSLTRRTSYLCSLVQQEMNAVQLAQGREVAIRSQAIREAKMELDRSNSTFTREDLQDVISEIKAAAPAKITYNHGVSLASRSNNSRTSQNAGMWKIAKEIHSDSGETRITNVANTDCAGLKKVPIYTKEARDKAEKLTIKFAEEASRIVKLMLSDDFEDRDVFNCLQELVDSMPDDPDFSNESPVLNEEEKSKVAEYKRAILSKLRGE